MARSLSKAIYLHPPDSLRGISASPQALVREVSKDVRITGYSDEVPLNSNCHPQLQS